MEEHSSSHHYATGNTSFESNLSDNHCINARISSTNSYTYRGVYVSSDDTLAKYLFAIHIIIGALSILINAYQLLKMSKITSWQLNYTKIFYYHLTIADFTSGVVLVLKNVLKIPTINDTNDIQKIIGDFCTPFLIRSSGVLHLSFTIIKTLNVTRGMIPSNRAVKIIFCISWSFALIIHMLLYATMVENTSWLRMTLFLFTTFSTLLIHASCYIIMFCKMHQSNKAVAGKR